ncbi:MAG: endonuclease [Saprospiraceae bacterium]|nr:endonuclease [Saprospiraceae bacterium]MBK9631915.1 endonuclease [Saprospiraceae bacterium]
MRPFLLLILYYFLNSNPGHTQWMNTTLFPGDSSFFLLSKLVNQYKPSTVLDYSNARVKMYEEIYNEKDTVYCVYSKHALYLNPMSIDPIGDLIKNGNPNGINCEHTFPQSKGADQGNARSDMHHLYPSRAAVNEARSNLPFHEIDDRQTTSWFLKSNSQSTIPSVNKDLYSEGNNSAFEPREDHKGNVARAIFYFMCMYELQADRTFFEDIKTDLCNWHLLDPVDSLEWQRTHLIGKYQNDKVNPFVLDCSLTRRTYCPLSKLCAAATSTQNINKLQFQLTSTLVENEVEINIDPNSGIKKFKITILDLNGVKVFEERMEENYYENIILLNVSHLPTGMYYIFVGNQFSHSIPQKIIKQ